MIIVAESTDELWLEECPSDDQGLVRPLVTRAGCVVLLCDSGGEVWLHPDDLESDRVVYPTPPDWAVAGNVTVEPGTTRWATQADVDDLDWTVTWHQEPAG